MATQLSVYNGALRLLKHRQLSSTSDDTETRYLLDNAYSSAIAYCLEQAQWTFATRTASTSGAATPAFGFTKTYTKATDFVRLVSISDTSTFYPPLEEYAEDSANFYASATTLYYQYVSDGASYGNNLTIWPETFTKVVECWLAYEVSPHLTSDNEYTSYLRGEFDRRLSEAKAKDAINRTMRVASSATTALYNGALRLVGQRYLENFSDDVIADRMPGQEKEQDQRISPEKRRPDRRTLRSEMELRRLLDESYSTVLAYCLEQGQWTFAARSTSSSGTVSAGFGFTKTFTKATDFVRLISISSASTFYPPLEAYAEDGASFFSDATTLYYTYVSDDASYGSNPSLWTASFYRLLEARLAYELAPHLEASVEERDALKGEYQMRLATALAKDTINRTSRVLTSTTTSLYNGALRLLGQRYLENFSDDVLMDRMGSGGDSKDQPSSGFKRSLRSEMELRRLLDESYDNSLADLLEKGQWNFAAKTGSSSGAATPAFGYTKTFTKETDFVRLIAISDDDSFYPPLEAYAESGSAFYADATTLYYTYVSDDSSYGANQSLWPTSFKQALEARLAYEIAPHLHIGPDDRGEIRSEYERRLSGALAKDTINRTMRVASAATTSIYNGALRLLGQRILENYSDDVLTQRMAGGVIQENKQGQTGIQPPKRSLRDEMELRRLLDESYTGVVEYLLEQGQWNFAIRSTSSAGTATPAFGYTKTFTKATDLVRLVAISDDDSFYPPLEDYAQDGASFFADAATLYYTYVSNDASYGLNTDLFTASFTKALEARLAYEISPHLNIDEERRQVVRAEYEVRLGIAIARDTINRTVRIADSTTSALYKAVMAILGHRSIENFSDDVVMGRMAREARAEDGTQYIKGERESALKNEMLLRRLFDENLSDVKAYMLEQGLWNFAIRTASLEPSGEYDSTFGYSYAFEKPTDYVRLNAIAADANFDQTLEDYVDEADFWVANPNPLYVSYISNDSSYGGGMSNWPESYKRAVEYEMAYRLAPHLNFGTKRMEEIERRRDRAVRDARSKDAMNQPAKRPPPGRLVRSRGGLRPRGDRPWWR